MVRYRLILFISLCLFLPQSAYSDLVLIPQENATTRINSLEQKFNKLGGQIGSNDQVENIENSIHSIKSELEEFKKIILKDPKTELSFQQLENEVDLMKKENQQIRSDISGYMGLAKWFIGSLVTLSVAIIGLLVMVMFREVKLTKIIERSTGQT